MSVPCVSVAYSAGRDSTALLYATLHTAKKLGFRVAALHVHHALSEHADAWLIHAQTQCQEWADAGWPVHLWCHRLAEKPARGESIEAWARRARYKALRQMALEAGASCVLLGHHRRDQAETILLQALRGAGINGLAGMPLAIERDGITWLRPWLRQPRVAIEAFVRMHKLRYVDDDSNEDSRFARNRLRLQVWPGLVNAFEHAEGALADAARWAQEASACLSEVAARDLAEISTSSGLLLRGWLALSPARQGNALRAWLKSQTGEPAPASLVVRLQRELPGVGPGCWPIAQGELRRYRGSLRFEPIGHARSLLAITPEATLSITKSGRFKLPGWGGELVSRRVKELGIPLAWLAHLELRPRLGGEQFQSGPGRPARSLKKQYQATGVPEWERDGPLLYSGGQLIFVPGLGIDARVLAFPGQPQMSLHWQGTRNR